MNKLNPFWYIAYSDSLPDSFSEGVVLSDGFEANGPDGIPMEQVSYALLCRTMANNEKEAHENIINSLQNHSILISSDIMPFQANGRLMSKNEFRIVTILELGDVSIHESFVGFKRNNREAQSVALNVIREAITKTKWQFWK
jgi:hypothetical protein